MGNMTDKFDISQTFTYPYLDQSNVWLKSPEQFWVIRNQEYSIYITYKTSNAAREWRPDITQSGWETSFISRKIKTIRKSTNFLNGEKSTVFWSNPTNYQNMVSDTADCIKYLNF